MFFFFQKNEIPLVKRIGTSRRCMDGSKSDISSPQSITLKNGDANMGGGDDLETVYSATKANKAALDDGSVQGSVENKTTKKIANAIDNVSRALFPLAFISYNIFYWTYY